MNVKLRIVFTLLKLRLRLKLFKGWLRLRVYWYTSKALFSQRVQSYIADQPCHKRIRLTLQRERLVHFLEPY